MSVQNCTEYASHSKRLAGNNYKLCTPKKNSDDVRKNEKIMFVIV